VQDDTIFVSGMDTQVTESDINNHFGAIGIIKKDKRTNKPKIWIYKDKETGLGKGECTITYDDPFTASSAIEWFDGKEFNNCAIKVQLAQRNSWQKGGPKKFGGPSSGERSSGGGGK
jgi:RNA-binding protein FUS